MLVVPPQNTGREEILDKWRELLDIHTERHKIQVGPYTNRIRVERMPDPPWKLRQ